VIADSVTGEPIVTSGGTFGKAADLQLLYRMGSQWFLAANGAKNGKMAHPRVSWSCRNYELPRLSPSLKKAYLKKAYQHCYESLLLTGCEGNGYRSPPIGRINGSRNRLKPGNGLPFDRASKEGTNGQAFDDGSCHLAHIVRYRTCTRNSALRFLLS
jgi:hypothetical protein